LSPDAQSGVVEKNCVAIGSDFAHAAVGADTEITTILCPQRATIYS